MVYPTSEMRGEGADREREWEWDEERRGERKRFWVLFGFSNPKFIPFSDFWISTSLLRNLDRVIYL